MSIKDYEYYEAKNKRDSNMLNFVFKLVSNKEKNQTLIFNKKHFLSYCNDATELYYEVCNGNVIRTVELENVTKRFFDLHVKNLVKCLKKGLEYNVEKDELSYILELFLSVNFGSFITKEYIIEILATEFEDKNILYQFEILVPYLKNDEIHDSVLDYSESSKQEKLIFLYKLGVLDFLRKKLPFGASTNQLAEYLGAVTGIKTSTVQSYINPIYSEKVIQKNNPLNNQTNVNKVEQALIKMGFKNEDFV